MPTVDSVATGSSGRMVSQAWAFGGRAPGGVLVLFGCGRGGADVLR